MKFDLLREISVLATVSDASTRNTLALRLAETRSPEVLAVLLRLIDAPELSNCRATLVHCLGFYKLAEHFDLLIDLVIGGNWEVAHEAYELLNSIEELDGDQVSKAYDRINGFIGGGINEEWRKEILQDTLSMFE